MSRNGITLEDTRAAIDALLERGEHPTHLSIREELGNTGSLSTISKHLDIIQATKVATQTPAIADIPKEVQEAFQDTLRLTWKAAIERSSSDILKVSQSIAGLREQLIDAGSLTSRMLEENIAHKETLTRMNDFFHKSVISFNKAIDALDARKKEISNDEQ